MSLTLDAKRGKGSSVLIAETQQTKAGDDTVNCLIPI